MNKWERTRAARFMRRVLRGDGAECWIWAGTKTAAGYGQLRVNGRKMYAHRYAYELEYGPIPDGLCVLHACDTPQCVNPEHLRVGTIADNSRDMVERDRAARYWAQQTHCRNGHEFTPENTHIQQSKDGPYRRCRACGRDAYHRTSKANSAPSVVPVVSNDLK